MKVKFLFKKPKTVYYPSFKKVEDLRNHYFRAKWYILGGKDFSETLMCYSGSSPYKEELITPPEYMVQRNISASYVNVSKSKLLYNRSLKKSLNIIVWDEAYLNDDFIKAKRKEGAHITCVDTDSISSAEFGRYCDFSWKTLISDKTRQAVLKESKERFTAVFNKIRGEYSRSCVFGTGPSIDKSINYNFEKVLCVICNSTVQNEKLLNHLDPRFVTAGDVVSHFGISRYAEVFRKDLLKVLKERDIYLVTTISFGYLFVEQFPEIKEKVILIPQGEGGANMNLVEDFRLPILDSTMNIHMLPLAATFTDTVFLIGGDGKNPNESDNEDFWAHSKQAQYHSLVDSGHLCHPTFDKLRQKSMYAKYLKSINTSLTYGEEKGKKFFSITPSFIEDISARELLNENKEIYLDKVPLTSK